MEVVTKATATGTTETKVQSFAALKGEKGDAATIQIGSVTKGDEAAVSNAGTETDAIFNFVLPKGDKGDKGEQGIQGEKGEKGDKGDTGEQGIQGDKGDKGDTGEQGIQGEKGIQGDKGDKGEPFTYDDFTEEQLAALKGADGTMSFEDLTEDQKAELKGDKGDKGDTGEQGIQGEQGEKGADGYTPQKGIDYWTAADKTEIVNDVLASLPTWEGGSY